VYTCGVKSLKTIEPLTRIVDVIPLKKASEGLSNKFIVRTSQEISKLWIGPDCSGCIPLKGLVNHFTNKTYTDPFVIYNSTTGALEIMTD
jgi:hypothetical protein